MALSYSYWFVDALIWTVYSLFRLIFGTLYPAYSSYKAVKSRNGRDYVKWMMYWIVFALFTAIETFADVFISWVPFYYEIKILFVIWLLSPATKGSSFLYRKFVHPQLMKREKEIDECITRVTDQGCSALYTIGRRGLNMAADTVVQTALKGQTAVVDHLRKSYSMNDLSDPNAKVPTDSEDDGMDDTDYYGPRKQQLAYQHDPRDRVATTRPHRHSRAKHDLSRVVEQDDDEEPTETVRRRGQREGIRKKRSKAKSTIETTTNKHNRNILLKNINSTNNNNENECDYLHTSVEQISSRTRSRSRKD